MLSWHSSDTPAGKYVCRYCEPERTFSDWDPFMFHAWVDHDGPKPVWLWQAERVLELWGELLRLRGEPVHVVDGPEPVSSSPGRNPPGSQAKPS